MLPSSAAASIAAFSVVAAVLVLTPGVGTTFLMSTVLGHGRRPAYLTAVGMTLGSVTHATVAALGTAVLLRHFPRALTWIAVVGGTVIIVFGARGLIRALRNPSGLQENGRLPRRPHGIILTGLLISLSNAPLPLFYFVVVPQYIPAGMSRLGGAALLSTIHVLMAFTWMITFVTLVGRMVEVLRRPRTLVCLQCAAGLLLIGLGAQAVLGGLR